MIRTIEVQVYSPDGSKILHRERQTAPPGRAFRNTDDAIFQTAGALDRTHPGTAFWRVIEVAGVNRTRIVKFVWNWEEVGALQAAMAVDQRHRGGPSQLVLEKCKDAFDHFTPFDLYGKERHPDVPAWAPR